jgi:hypothetical protein
MKRRLAVVALALACVIATPALARHRHHKPHHHHVAKAEPSQPATSGGSFFGGGSVAAIAERYVGHTPSVAELKSWAAQTGIGTWRFGVRVYCALGVNKVLADAGRAGSGSFQARSFKRWGTQTSDPQPGDVAVKGNHHVAIVVGRTTAGVTVVSFNDAGHGIARTEYPLRGVEYRTASGRLALN